MVRGKLDHRSGETGVKDWMIVHEHPLLAGAERVQELGQGAAK
jgi:hypothetical protein